MLKKCGKILIAFVTGQIVQIICTTVCLNLYVKHPIPFCAAAGFLVSVAVFAGMRLAAQEHREIMQKADYQY